MRAQSRRIDGSSFGAALAGAKARAEYSADRQTLLCVPQAIARFVFQSRFEDEVLRSGTTQSRAGNAKIPALDSQARPQ